MSELREKAQWYYVVYRDYPKGKPFLSSKHFCMDAAIKAMEKQKRDPFWEDYFWSVTTEEPA